jgi:hypothetical protein
LTSNLTAALHAFQTERGSNRADPGSEPKARFANWRGGRAPESGMASAGSRIVECHSCHTRLTLQGAQQLTFTSRCPAWTLLCFVGNHQTFQCPICSAYVTDHHAAALQQPAPRPVLCSNVRPLRIGDPTTQFTQIICSCMCAVSYGSDAAARSATLHLLPLPNAPTDARIFLHSAAVTTSPSRPRANRGIWCQRRAPLP